MGNAQGSRNNASRMMIHGLTSREARKQSDSIVRAEKIKKSNKLLDTLNNILIRHISDSLLKNGTKKPQNRKLDDGIQEVH
jgi:hemin uptake protein HemP